MPRRIKLYEIGAVLLIASVGIKGSRLEAYNQSGHMETVRLIVEKSLHVESLDGFKVLPFAVNEKELVDFCAQLPDLSEELDATRVYMAAVGSWSAPVKWIAWGFFNHPMDDDYRRMIAVQQLQHALTGGDAASMRRVATTTLSSLLMRAARTPGDRSIELCALGLSFHLYGDTFAHTQMPWEKPTVQTVLYPTGRGHAFDGHFPDYILCNFFTKAQSGSTDCHQSNPANPTGLRFNSWIAYWTRVQSIVTDSASPKTPLAAIQPDVVFTQPPPLMGSLVQAVLLAADRGYSDDKTDTTVGDILRDRIDAGPAADPASVAYDSDLELVIRSLPASLTHAPACNSILGQAAAKLSMAGNAVGRSACASIWKLYADTVIANLKNCFAPGKVEAMPECSGKIKALDSSWVAWLQNDQLAAFAGLVSFK